MCVAHGPWTLKGECKDQAPGSILCARVLSSQRFQEAKVFLNMLKASMMWKLLDAMEIQRRGKYRPKQSKIKRPHAKLLVMFVRGGSVLKSHRILRRFVKHSLPYLSITTAKM